MICNNCPRKCNIDRDNQVSFCGVNNTLKLAKTDVFMLEEPIVSGTNGSGAIFFSGCNLKCCFCQNYKISHLTFGKEITIDRLAEIFKELEDKNVHNINLVSPSHYYKQIIEALKIYRPKIPVVYNSNGYETVESINELSKYVDIFIVDLKFYDALLSKKYCKAENYFDVASNTILKMLELKPKVIVKNGIIQSGVIIRHLVMPGLTKDSGNILQWISKNAKDKCLVSLMSQYTPYYKSCNYPEINRRLKPIEYKSVLSKALSLGLTDVFVQDLESASEKYIPIWDLKGV